jgi:predicted metal-dependent HD superfamily phosphohydrolase
MHYRIPCAAELQHLEARWHTFLPHADQSLVSQSFARLAAKYGEPQRFYHTTGYLTDIVALWEQYEAHLHDPAPVGLALFYHDVVYDIGAADNEARSAVYAERDLPLLGLPRSTIARIMALITMTATHTCAASDTDAALMLDMDMAILGAPLAVYERYRQAIEAEYTQCYALATFLQGRRDRFLAVLLHKPRIFLTEVFESTLGLQARANLAQEYHLATDRLAHLDGPGAPPASSPVV